MVIVRRSEDDFGRRRKGKQESDELLGHLFGRDGALDCLPESNLGQTSTVRSISGLVPFNIRFRGAFSQFPPSIPVLGTI